MAEKRDEFKERFIRPNAPVKDLREYIGMRGDTMSWEYSWSDVIMANMAFGADANEMHYSYCQDEGFRALPAFCLIPALSMGLGRPRAMGMGAPSMYVQLLNGADGLDWDHELIIYRPVDPIKGTLSWYSVLDDVYDRGPGKGVVMSNTSVLMDEAFRVVAKNICRTVMFAQGGFGGQPVPKPEAEFPDRAPDVVDTYCVSEWQNLLYSAMCGQSPIHNDREFCQGTMHFKDKLCTGPQILGCACHAAVKNLIPGEDHRVRRLYAQFRNPLFPDEQLRFMAWKMGEKKVCFRVENIETGKIILNNGIFEWE